MINLEQYNGEILIIISNFRIQYDHPTDAMLFKTNGNIERVRITSDGKVGIGTDNPSSTVHIAHSNPAVRITDENQLVDNKSWNISAGNL